MKKRRRGEADSSAIMTAVLVVFIALKLAGVIDWSWWIVLLPAWFELAIVLAGLGLVSAITAVLFSLAWVGEWLSRLLPKGGEHRADS